MENKQKKVFLVVLGLVVAFLLIRPYLFPETGTVRTMPVAQQLQVAFRSEKPLAIVFSYGAECCPSTEEFYVAYDAELQQTLGKYKDVESVWLNVGAESSADQEAILELAQQYGITQVPSLLILDGDREMVARFEGEFDAVEAEGALSEVVDL